MFDIGLSSLLCYSQVVKNLGLFAIPTRDVHRENVNKSDSALTFLLVRSWCALHYSYWSEGW